MRRGEAGYATIEFIICMGFGVLVAAGLYITSAWPAEINAANAAAYEAARAAVEAPTNDEGQAAGTRIAQEVMANHGYGDTALDVTFSAAGRGEFLTATVHTFLPALRFPGLGSWDAIGFSKSSTQRVADYRSYG